jgi:hypothetical protein
MVLGITELWDEVREVERAIFKEQIPREAIEMMPTPSGTACQGSKKTKD